MQKTQEHKAPKDGFQKYSFRIKGNRRIKRPVIGVILSLWILSAGVSISLTACGNKEKDLAAPDSMLQHSAPQESSAENSMPQEVSAEDSTLSEDSPFHSTSYFRDDTGRSIQCLDGFLYGYWNGQLCRYDSETLKQYRYSKAASNQSGRFCIYEDHIFYLERPNTASLTGTDTCLYMADLEGHSPELLTPQVPNAAAVDSGYNNCDDYYEIDIYNDIIYLIGNSFCENVYYRLNKKFYSVTRIEESETLYGLLPDGYSEPAGYPRLPSLPCQMRHYGFLFLTDADGNLAAYDVESGRLENIEFPTDNIARRSVFLTNDALYCAEEADSSLPLTTWYRISLDDLRNAEKWGQFFPMERYTGDDIFYDESGAYFVKKEGSVISLYQIPWDGRGITLLYSRYLRGGESFQSPTYGERYLCYTDGDFFYFNEKEDSQYCVMRVPLYTASSEPEIVAVYYEDLTEDFCIPDTLEHTFTVKADVDGETVTFYCYTSFTSLLLTEKTKADHNINSYLKNIYREIQTEIASFGTFPDSDGYYPLPDEPESYMRVTAYPNYLNENYIGITIATETYYCGGTHPNTWSEEYVFDRRTGKRVAITDIVENSPEEICEIVSTYVDRDRPWLHFYEDQEHRASILEDSRFFLSEEGIGIHFNTYEIADYAEGDQDYIIPFWEFDLKSDTIDYRNREKVQYKYWAWLEVTEPPLDSYIDELGKMLEEQLKAGTLSEFWEEHASGYRELSFEEILEKMAADQNGVLKQYYISEKRKDDQWLCLEGSEDIWIRQSREWEGTPYWNYLKFPRGGDSYHTSLDAASFCEEYGFFVWKDTNYLVTVSRDGDGGITGISIHCLLADSVYNGWILRLTLEENGEVTMECLNYWM